MNQNPWYVDNAAQYERNRIREEMRQIRLEERAKRAQPRPIRLVLLLVARLRRGRRLDVARGSQKPATKDSVLQAS